MARVLASATVDTIQPSTPKRPATYRIKVWGQKPYDYTRYYEIQSKTDTLAAQRAIDLFVAEVSKLGEQGS